MMQTTVLILVLMEWGLSHHKGVGDGDGDRVLILVLMEWGLSPLLAADL